MPGPLTMPAPHYAAYPTMLPRHRPQMPDTRPHTVHASSPGNFIAEERAEDDSDDQSTPRASLAGLNILSGTAERRMSRDDTAADVSMLVPPYGPVDPKQPVLLEEPLNAWTSAQEETLGQLRSQRRSARQRFGLSSSASYASSVAESSESGGMQYKPASLGRRISRNYKKVLEHAPLPSRIRRSSTPQSVDSNAPAAPGQGCPNAALLQPLSPSKRNAKQADGRYKKLRSGLLALNDRKDTPAPPTFGGPAARPASRHPTQSTSVWLAGGDGARAAAAKFNNPSGFFHEDGWSLHDEDLQLRRRRLGSLSSAADSGADLSTFGGSSCNDSVQDVDDMVLDEKEPRRFDMIEQLPSEISLQIFEYLDAPDLSKAERAGPLWRSLANEPSVWRSAFLRRFQRQVYTDPEPIQVGGIGVGRANKPDQQWKRMYKARLQLEQHWRMGAKDAGKAIYLSGHTDSVYCVQFDEEKIITGSRDRTIRVWDINTYECKHVIGGPPHQPVIGPKVLRTVDYPAFHAATASVNGTRYGNSIYKAPSDWHDASILCLQYDHEILVTGSSDSDLIVWDIQTYEPIKRLKRHTGGVLDVALDAKHIISCSKDSRIIIWDRATFEYRGELTGHRGPVNAVQLRGKQLVSASGDGIARLWDLEQMKLVKEFSAKERGLAAVEFSEDTKYVLAGGNDHITYKFETDTGKEVMQFTGHSQLVRSLWLDSANNRVVSGSYDLDLRVYDFVTGQEIWRAEEWTTSWMLAAKSDYRRIVATSQDGRILVVDFGLQQGGHLDGEPIEHVDLLRGTERTSAIQFRNPWVRQGERSDTPMGVRNG